VNKLVQRLLIFFLGIPAVAAIILLLPHYNHLAFNIVTVIFSTLGAAEFSVLLSQKKITISKTEAAVLGAIVPVTMILTVTFGFNGIIVPAAIAGAVFWLLVTRIFSRGEILESTINRFAAGIAALIYPGMLMAWIIRMSRWQGSSHIIILTFLCTVFASDSAAWAVGMLFGKGNQGIVPASPNKSVAGFIGGFIAPVIIGTASAIFWPEIFIPKYEFLKGNVAICGALLGFLTGIAATMGDLGESALKRSSSIKDSGKIIPGRGGVLDSIDSIALAAPVFYLAFRILFAQP